MAPPSAQAILNSPRSHCRTFGARNPERIFYVIWRRDLAGFFSNFAHVLSHLKIADELQITPIVDFRNFPNLYNDNSVTAVTPGRRSFFRCQNSRSPKSTRVDTFSFLTALIPPGYHRV